MEAGTRRHTLEGGGGGEDPISLEGEGQHQSCFSEDLLTVMGFVFSGWIDALS